MKHLDEAQLLQLALGQLDDSTQAEVLAHLSGCPECRARNHSLSSTVFSRTLEGVASPLSDIMGAQTRPDRPDPSTPGLVLQRGASLGRYVLIEKLGVGGMGEVFAAFDPQLDRKVALKLLRGGSLSAEEGRARLLREAQAMARLQHPNVIAVHDVGTIGDRVFIAMEFVEGETIAEWLRGNHGWREVIELFRQAGAGLGAAHEAGLVHRDFKPENVLIGGDHRPRVLDFGLARQTTSSGSGLKAGDVPEGLADSPLARPLTRDGAVMGTPGYMAPEQLAGLSTDARSDQFSFCVALYEALYGRRPFGGATLKQHALEMATGKVPGPPANTVVPGWIAPVIARGLEPDPSKRWPDMRALLEALRPPAERSPARSWAFAVLVLLAVLGLGSAVWTRQRFMVCGGQDQPVREAWNAASRAALKQAFLSSKLAFAGDAFSSVDKTLEAWVVDWASTAREVCEATKVRKVEPQAVMDLRMACLDERLQRLRSLTALFAQADRDVVMNAPVAAKYLESPLECGARAPGAVVKSEEERKAEAELRADMADAQALFGAGKYEQASLKLKSSLRRRAPDLAVAEGWLLLGRIELRLGDPKAAATAHLAAAEHAIKSGDDALSAVALSRLSANEGYDDDDSNADLLDRLAQASASRVAGEWTVAVELARNESLVEIRRKRYRPALSDLERVLTLQREHLNSSHPDVAATLNNVGTVLTRLGRYEEAIRSYQQSLTIHEEVEGAGHPNTAAAQHNLAVTYRLLGRLPESKALFERALSARRTALGLRHPDTLSTALSLAKVCISMSELDSAAQLLAEVRAAREEQGTPRDMWGLLEAEAELSLAGRFWREAHVTSRLMLELAHQLQPGDSPLATTALVVQGRALTGLGSWAEARRALNEAQAQERKRDEKHRDEKDQVEIAEALGHLELEQGHFREALPHLTQALELRDRSAVPSRGLALLLVELGHCEVELGLLTESRAHAERAVKLLEAMAVPADLQRARFLVGMATRLAADGGEPLEPLVAQLPELERPAARQWLTAHGLDAPDAGR